MIDNSLFYLFLAGIASFLIGWFGCYRHWKTDQKKNQHVLFLKYNEFKSLLNSLEVQAEYGDPKSFARKRAQEVLASMKTIETIYTDLYGTDIRKYNPVSG